MKKEDKMYLDQLTMLSGDITKKIVTPEYSHMLDMWKAFIGGFVCPEIAKINPESIDDKRKALMAKYDSKTIHKMFHPDPKTVEVEKIVEKIVYRDRVVTQPQTDPSDGTPGTIVQTGNRRFRPSVNKISRKKREMKPEERANVITKFNQHQSLMDKGDDLCSQIVKDHNALLAPGEDKTYPAQVAGYWSWLCRIVLDTPEARSNWFDKALKKGVLPNGCPLPEASDKFIKLIIENQEKEQALEAHRKAYSTHMRGAPLPEDNVPSSIAF